MNGALALNGAWCPGQGSCSGPSVTQPETPVRTTGSLDVSDLGSVPFIGSVGPGSYAFDLGCSGCVFQGRPDTLPPATCSATVSPTSFNASAAGATFTVTVTTGNACQWTASGSGFVTIAAGVSRFGSGIVQVSVAQNTGAARTGSATVAGQTVTVNQAAGTVPPTTLDLSGNWTQSFAGGTQTMILMQSGSNLTGRAVGGAVAGVIQTSTVTGTVSGNVVTLMEVDTATTTVQGITASCRITINYTLTASSSSRMTGSYTFTGTCTVTGLPPGTPLPPLPPISGNGSVTFTK